MPFLEAIWDALLLSDDHAILSDCVRRCTGRARLSLTSPILLVAGEYGIRLPRAWRDGWCASQAPPLELWDDES